MVKKCKACGTLKTHYAKGLCRSCYNKMLRHKFTDVKQLQDFESEKDNKRRKRKQISMERMKVRSTNEYVHRPHGVVSKAVFNWYYDTEDKYLIMDFNNKSDVNSAWQNVYAMAKRRHKLPVKYWRENTRLVVERLA